MTRKAHLHIEGVPNPLAMKFVLENGILTEEAFEFQSYQEASVSPLARKLLLLRYVDRVLIFRNHITVLKTPDPATNWDSVLYEVRMLIQQHLEDNEPILYMGSTSLTHERSDDVVVQIIVNLLDEHIRPAAQEDGGDILFESYESGVLNLSMHGACHGCIYVNKTLKKGVEPLIMGLAPEVKKVVARGNGVS